MFKNLRKLVLAILAVTLTGALTVGAATLNANADDTAEAVNALTGYNITLKDDIAIKYHFTVPEGYTSAEMTFTLGEGGSTVTAEPQTGLTAGSEVIFTLNDLAPDDMTKSVTAQVIWTGENGKTGVEELTAHTVKGYLETLLKNSLNGKVTEIDTQEKFDALKSLVSNILSYGDAAQTYVGATASSTEGLTVAEKNAAVKATASSSDLSFEGTAVEGLVWTGATLVFGDKVDVVYYFKATDAFAAEKTLGVLVDNVFCEAEVSSVLADGSTEYVAKYEGLSVTDFDKVLSATVASKASAAEEPQSFGTTVKYSVKSYVNRISASATATENMKSLAAAAYSYGVSVNEYLSALSAEEIDYNGETVTINATTDVTSFDTYLADTSFYGLTPKFDLSLINKAGTGFGSTFVHSAVTDGTYIYYLTCGTGKATNYSRSYYIFKYDPATNNVVGRTASFSARKGSGDWNSDTYLIAYYKDEAIYVFDIDNNLLSVSVNDFDANGTVAPAAVENAPEFALSNTTGETTVGVSGMAYKDGKYATLDSNGVLRIYAEADLTKVLAKVQCAIVPSGGGSAMRLTAYGNYLYALSLSNGQMVPTVTVVDWYGAKVDVLRLPVTREFLGIPETVKKTVNEVETDVAFNDFNVQNFVVIGDKAYAVMYVNSFNGKSLTPLITATLVNQNETFEYEKNYSLAERSEAGLDTVATTTLMRGYSGAMGGNFVYASTTDGKYAYFVAGASADSVAICKYDLENNKSVATTASLGSVKEGDVYAFVKDGLVYVYSHTQNKMFCVSTGFTDGAVAFEADLAFSGVSGTITGVYYSAMSKRFAVRVGTTIYVCGEDLAAKYSFTILSGMTIKNYQDADIQASGKTLFGEGDYIYVNCWAAGGVSLGVTAYSFAGCKLYSDVIENTVHNKTNGDHKLESVISLNGNLYSTILSWSGKTGSALFKTTFSSTKQENVSVSAGEYYEKEGAIALTDLTVTKLTDNGVTNNVHGFATDGVYGYTSSSAGTKTEAKVIVTKFFLQTNATVGYVYAPVANESGKEVYDLGHNLFVYDGYVYVVVREDKTTYKIAFSDIDNSGKQMEKVENFFGGAVSYAEAAYYDEANDRFAVRVGANLYAGKANDLKLIRQTVSGSGKKTGVYADENYIYVMSEHGTAGYGLVNVAIYTWDGTAVSNGTYGGLKTTPSVGSSNNVQSMFMVNGKVYFLVCQWGAGYKLDADGNKISVKNEDGTDKVDEKGNVVYETVSTGAYVASGYLAKAE